MASLKSLEIALVGAESLPYREASSYLGGVPLSKLTVSSIVRIDLESLL
jgi:hypothetical protein